MPQHVPRQAAITGVVAAALLSAVSAIAAEPDAVTRGAYLAAAGDCAGCHTDGAHHGKPFAGGVAIPTPFGTFYAPNITPDPETGIGRFSDRQFMRALRDGVRPDGTSYYPAFPYPSFTNITDADILALKAYLFSQPPVHQANRPHDLAFPYSWRFLLKGWKFLYFRRGPFRPVPERGAEWNRGAYLVTALAHCGECHTPRGRFGGPEKSRFLAGTAHGPDDKPVPNITPDHATGIGDWSQDDIVTLLATGQMPGGDFAGGTMAAVVKSTARLTDADRRAIAAYLKTVPAVASRVRK